MAKEVLSQRMRARVRKSSPCQRPRVQRLLLTTKNTLKLFESETYGEINVFFVVWSVWSRRKHKFHKHRS